MANLNYDLKPCTILATTQRGYRIETANAIREVSRSDVVQTATGWGLIVRDEKAAENQNQAA